MEGGGRVGESWSMKHVTGVTSHFRPLPLSLCFLDTTKPELFLAHSPTNVLFCFPTDPETVLATWGPQTPRAKINLPPFPSGILEQQLEHTLAAYSPF